MKYSKVSVLVPTRRRIEYLKRMLKSYHETIANPYNSEFVFRVDSDDMETAEFLATVGWPVIIGERKQGYKSLPGFYNEMVGQATGDIFVCGNDDMIFETADWPRLIIEEANKYPDGIFNIGVNTDLNDENYPFSIVSRQLVERLGRINDERLLFSDIYLLDIARHFDRAIRLRTVTIRHDWAGHTNDPTRRDGSQHEYNDVWDQKPGFWSEDYRRRHNAVVDEAIGKLDPTDDSRAERLLSEFQQKTIEPIKWASRDSSIGLHYGRNETKTLFGAIIRSGVARNQAVVTDHRNGLPGSLWEVVFDRVVTLSNNTTTPNGRHQSRSDDAMAMLSIFERAGNIDLLVLEGSRYADISCTYHLLQKVLAKPGMVVFVGTAARAAQPYAAPRFIADLRSGELDGIRHNIIDIAPQDGAGFCYEMMT